MSSTLTLALDRSRAEALVEQEKEYRTLREKVANDPNPPAKDWERVDDMGLDLGSEALSLILESLPSAAPATSNTPLTDKLRAAIKANPDSMIDFFVGMGAHLGAHEEWSMDDNFAATEGLAGVITDYAEHAAHDQDEEALRYWSAVCEENGIDHPNEFDDEDEEDEEDEE